MEGIGVMAHCLFQRKKADTGKNCLWFSKKTFCTMPVLLEVISISTQQGAALRIKSAPLPQNKNGKPPRAESAMVAPKHGATSLTEVHEPMFRQNKR